MGLEQTHDRKTVDIWANELIAAGLTPGQSRLKEAVKSMHGRRTEGIARKQFRLPVARTMM